MQHDYYEYNKKKSPKAITVIEIIIIAIFAIVIIGMISMHFMFGKEGAHPKVFGNYLYLSRVTTMVPSIPENSVITAKPAVESELVPGKVVLCNIDNNGKTFTTILRIQDVQLDDGKTYYILKADTNPQNMTYKAPADSVFATCESMSVGFGKLIAFATSDVGLIAIVIIPCILVILIQVLRIVRLKNEDDDDEFDTDEVLFSTRRHFPQDQEEAYTESLPVKQAYVGDEGKASYNNRSAPNSDYKELHDTMKNNQSSAMHIPTATATATRVGEQRSTVSSNFKHKPTSRDYEFSSEIYFEKPTNKYSPSRIEDDYERPKIYYEKPVAKPIEPKLEPPVIENPVDITIPVDAVKPKETIAPPPKKQSNKTVEELMRVIDQAQSGLKK